MPETDSKEGAEDPEPVDEYREIPLGERRVQDAHRVNIPLDLVGIEVGEKVDAYFEPAEDDVDFDPFVVPGLPVRSGGRITIPSYRRRDRGVGEGDTVEVTVRVPK